MTRPNRTRPCVIHIETSEAERAMVEEKAEAEGVCMRELITRAVAAYRAMPVSARIDEIEKRLARLEAK